MYRVLRESYVHNFLAIIGVATIVIGTTYTMVQQSTRLSADDTPLALGQTIKNELESGASPNDVITSQNIDLRSNVNPFVIITDNSRHVLAATATLDGQAPLPPRGVFDFTSQNGTDHFTWQPADNVRMATRIYSYGKNGQDNSGFVVTGQSLKPYEDRIDTYGELALAAWVATIAWTFFWLVLPKRLRAAR